MRFSKEFFAISLLVLSSCCLVFGQEDPILKDSENKLAQKLQRNEPRPKFFEFRYSGVENFDVKTEDSSSEVDLNKRVRFNLRAPLILKPNHKLFLGLTLRNEFFEFQNTQPEDSDFFNEFNRQQLNTTGVSFIYKIDRTEEKFYYLFWNGSLNSDVITFNQFWDQLKTSVVFIWAKNTTPITQIGFGGGFGYIFGGPSVFPAIIYNSTFSAKWNVEMLLPKSVKLRYNPIPETFLLFGLEVTGASYFLQEQPVEGYDKLTFQRSTLEAKVQFEREIYDFFWFSVSAGYNIPLNLYLSEPRKPKREGIVNLNATASPIISGAIFLVVPKKIYYKKAKTR